MYFEAFVKDFSALPQVEAIALGGSRAGFFYDEKSDFDVYVYVKEMPMESVRREILSRHCSYMEINNTFWETEDDCTFKDGIDIDIIYRDLMDFEEALSFVVEGCHAGNGYTTCFWHNAENSKILYDEEGRLTAMKERFDVPYPEMLRKNIVDKNRKLLSGFLPSYAGQIKKAADRNDQVSVCHRTAAFMESYFDIIFALNRLTHPGEKRMVSYAVKNCSLLPDRFEENIEALYSVLFSDKRKAEQIICSIVEELDRIL